jgi:hypothetical protein
MIMNKLQSFLTENFELVEAIEPGDHETIDGGTLSMASPDIWHFTISLPTFDPPFGQHQIKL